MPKGARGTRVSVGRKAKATADTSYQGKQFNRATGTGKTADKMAAEISKLAPNAIKANQEAIAQIQAVSGNPNATITIYRATVGDTINNGDWVFLEKSLAERWTKTAMGTPKPGVKVLQMKVKAKDVDWTGKNLEFGYFPSK